MFAVSLCVHVYASTSVSLCTRFLKRSTIRFPFSRSEKIGWTKKNEKKIFHLRDEREEIKFKYRNKQCETMQWKPNRINKQIMRRRNQRMNERKNKLWNLFDNEFCQVESWFQYFAFFALRKRIFRRQFDSNWRRRRKSLRFFFFVFHFSFKSNSKIVSE